jgi:hypothetical protein
MSLRAHLGVAAVIIALSATFFGTVEVASDLTHHAQINPWA